MSPLWNNGRRGQRPHLIACRRAAPNVNPNPPCNATDLVHFRNRIGEQGIELILKESICVNDDDNDNSKNDTAFIDSTGGNATRRLPDGACIKQM